MERAAKKEDDTFPGRGGSEKLSKEATALVGQKIVHSL